MFMLHAVKIVFTIFFVMSCNISCYICHIILHVMSMSHITYHITYYMSHHISHECHNSHECHISHGCHISHVMSHITCPPLDRKASPSPTIHVCTLYFNPLFALVHEQQMFSRQHVSLLLFYISFPLPH